MVRLESLDTGSLVANGVFYDSNIEKRKRRRIQRPGESHDNSDCWPVAKLTHSPKSKLHRLLKTKVPHFLKSLAPRPLQR